MLFEEMVIGGVIVGIIGTIDLQYYANSFHFYCRYSYFYEYMRFIGSLEQRFVINVTKLSVVLKQIVRYKMIIFGKLMIMRTYQVGKITKNGEKNMENITRQQITNCLYNDIRHDTQDAEWFIALVEDFCICQMEIFLMEISWKILFISSLLQNQIGKMNMQKKLCIESPLNYILVQYLSVLLQR